MQQMWNRLQLLFAHGVSTLVGNDKVQAKVLDGEVLDNLARVEPYGFSYHPQPGSQSYLLFPSGDRSYGVAIMVGDKRYQMDLQSGEVSLHDDIGHSVTLQRGGIAVAGGGHAVTITGAPTVVVTGGDVVADGVSLKNHVHSGVQPGSGVSGPPVGGGSGGSGGGGSGGGGGVTPDDLNNAISASEAALVATIAAQAAAISVEINTAVSDAQSELNNAIDLARLEISDAFAAADAVIDANVSALSSTVGTVSASLTAESITRANADSALSASITTLNSSIGTVSADLSTESITRATADSALSASITTLNSSIGTVSANLSTESATRATADSALSASITSLNSSIGTVSADLSTESITRANADSALSASITSLSSSIGTVSADLSTEAITRANADGALSASISTLSSTVGGHTSSIATLASTQNGLSARWGVTLNNNGHITGFATYSDMATNGVAPTSAFVVQADKFVFVSGSTPYTDGNNPNPANVPFKIVGGVTYIKEANVEDLSIGGVKIKNNAISNIDEFGTNWITLTNAAAAVTAGLTYFPGSLATQPPGVSIKRIFLFNVTIEHNDATPGTVVISLWRSIGGTFVGSLYFHPSINAAKQQTLSGMLFDYVGASDAQIYTVSYQLVNAANTWNTSYVKLKVDYIALTVKK